MLRELAEAGDHIFFSVQENGAFSNDIISDKKIQLQPSRLKDDDAPILGVSSLVWKHIEL